MVFALFNRHKIDNVVLPAEEAERLRLGFKSNVIKELTLRWASQSPPATKGASGTLSIILDEITISYDAVAGEDGFEQDGLQYQLFDITQGLPTVS